MNTPLRSCLATACGRVARRMTASLAVIASLLCLTATAHADRCPSFHLDGIMVDVVCTQQDFKEHTFMDADITNTSGQAIGAYRLVVALYDKHDNILASQRVERMARQGMMEPGATQRDRFIVVNVAPADVARVDVWNVPR